MKTLKKIFDTFLSNNNIDSKSKFLFAVSGGVDSMVCLHIGKKLGLEMGIAHVNFQLRGDESDLDSEMVKKYCTQNKLPFHLMEIDTKKHALDEKLSIQEAARNIRYSFFDSILTDNNYDYIVTAHHQEDNIETLFLHLNRGSGVKGLSGIPSKRNQIIRPLLSVQKKQIIEYANQNKVPYREDSSNKELKYDRNFIRNKVLPSIKEQFPEFHKNASNSISLINEEYRLFIAMINEKIDPLVENTDNGYRIKFDKSIPELAWYHHLKKYGFNRSQIYNLVSNDHQVGKKFQANDYILYIDRDYWIIQKPINIDSTIYNIPINTNLDHPINIDCRSIKKPKHLKSSKEIAYFDLDKLTFPLELRKWMPGDKIKPIGMKGFKKVSDLLIDLKVPLPEKQKIYVLLSNKKIIWVIGKKISNDFLIDETTKTSYKISINKD